MKKYIFSVLILVLLSFGSALAKKGPRFVEKATVNYLHALDKDIGPLVESAIFNLIVFKQLYPEYNYNAVITKLTSLSMNSDIPAVRYKAFLALNYFKNLQLLGAKYSLGNVNPIAVFNDISEKMAIQNKINFINGK